MGEIASVGAVEHHGVPFVALALRDPAKMVAQGDGTAHLRRYLARQCAWTGTDIWIDASNFGLDAVLLAQAIGRYAASPPARAELAQRLVPEHAE